MLRVLHKPVLLDETIRVLRPMAGERILDCTVGHAGHALELLKNTLPSGELVALDADERNLDVAREALNEFSSHVTLLHENFQSLQDLKLGSFDVIFADLGLNSAHIEDAQRGFSFRTDAPLDMRFDASIGATAAEWLSTVDEKDLSWVLKSYGELTQTRRLAGEIVASAPKSTEELKRCVEKVFRWRTNRLLPQVFQAIRMKVNDELAALKSLLITAPTLLNPGGRLCIISFHSLEDRLVKSTFRDLSAPAIDDRTGQISTESRFALLTRKVVVPSAKEIADNPRARSAKLRCIQKRVEPV